jgi:DNA-binding SARP family transcriptional activator/tetratricopeptide (TPR) repeat protein
VEFRVLGPMEARDGTRVIPMSPMVRDLLALLLCHPGAPVSADRLIDALWADPPRTAVKSLQVKVHGLRRALGDDARVVYRPPGYALLVKPGELDASEFEVLVGRGIDASATEQASEGAELLRRALAMWRGPAFAGQELLPVVREEAARLAELRLRATEDLTRADLALGRHADVVADLFKRVAEHPFRECTRTQLMIALYRLGRPAEALEVYAEGRRRLVDELGLEPGQELRDLERAILNQDPSLDLAAATGTEDAAPRRQAREVPAQLPLDLVGFVGRSAELSRLDAVLGETGEESTAVVISALLGTAGVGKTALAVHWAHSVADRFPDGQLYVNLRGFTPGGSVMDPAEAVRGFLGALGVAPQRIPASLDAQVGLYRSMLAGRRMLVVLDNARDAEQVRPLLPGAPGSLVIVTSRNQMSGLVAAEAAHPLRLDLLSRAEAWDLLGARLGETRVAAEPEAVEEIVDRCARLPLALAIVAAQAAARPDLPLHALADQLRDSKARLDALAGGTDGDAATDVRAVFSWSYHTLTAPVARLFRLLGLHSGPDFSAPAAASLAGIPPSRVPSLLTELTRAHLVDEHRPCRFAFHDLLSAYAGELAEATESDADRREARLRVLDHYLHTAHAAALLLYPYRDSISVGVPRPEVRPESLADMGEALDWFTAERRVLLGTLYQAADMGFDTHTWQLAWALTTLLDRQGHWRDQAATPQITLDAARRTNDQFGQAHAHRDLARAYVRLGRFEDALPHLEQALELFGRLGDRRGQARTRLWLGMMLEGQERYSAALRQAQLAHDLYRATGDRDGQATALNAVGWDHIRLGNHRQALTYCWEALALHEEAGDRQGEADAWDSLGYAHHHLGQYREAIDCYRHAIDTYRQVGDRYGESDTLVRLGATHRAAGDCDAARDSWKQALAILDQLKPPAADQVRAKLDDLPS